MKKYIQVLSQFFRFSLQQLLEYRADLFLWGLVSTGWTLFSLLFYEILFLQTTNVAGWSKEHMYVFLGIFMIIDTATWSFFWRNMQMYARSIFDGSLDFLLLQPIDVQFRLSFRHLSFTNMPRLFIGMFLVMTHLRPFPDLLHALLFICLLTFSIFLIYLLFFFVTTCTFWVDKLDNIVEIVPALRRIWSIPSDIYSGPISALLTIVIPLGLITTVPTRLLLNTDRWDQTIVLMIFCIIFFLLTRAFFHFSIKKYSSVGS
ncbi:MAG: ABC-2 family transporter protein [Candidatus Pacebacteria bacterium]|nr:ABC-2 family transporter protein [Candidatus Paceibacterota bacterium]